LIAAVAGLAITMTGCEVNQIDWRNHYYVVSGTSCVDYGALTVHNGSGFTDPVAPLNNGRELEPLRVDVIKTVYGDMTGDGVNDVAVLLRCSYAAAPHVAPQAGYEIQVFTRNGAPVERITPDGNGNNNWYYGPCTPTFDPSVVYYQAKGESAGHLITGMINYDSIGDQCRQSGEQSLVWYWYPNTPLSRAAGSNGFVGVLPTING
jgi:hypothetical protein